MTKHSCLFAAVLALLYVTVAVAQHPALDAVANKVVQKYQTSSCQQLMQQKAQKQPPSAGEQKAMELLRTDPEMRHEFVSIVADQVVDKLIQCGMIP
jgi:peptide subunit release factor 1 (eRF1)